MSLDCMGKTEHQQKTHTDRTCKLRTYGTWTDPPSAQNPGFVLVGGIAIHNPLVTIVDPLLILGLQNH